MADRPSPSDLWQQAGGDGDRYRELMREHGHLLGPGDDGYEEGARDLPCGWPPRRSIVAVEFLQPDRDGQVRALITCDCGTATDLTVEIRGETPGTAEAAFTCDGCQAAHWFEMRATG